MSNKKWCLECHTKRKNCVVVVRRAGGKFDYVCKVCYQTRGYRDHLGEYYDQPEDETPLLRIKGDLDDYGVQPLGSPLPAGGEEEP